MDQQIPRYSPDTTCPAQMQARARQIPSYLQAYDVALPPSLLPVTGPYKSYQQPKMDHVAVPSTLSGQAELASTGVQPIRHESSSLQYGSSPVIISGSNIDTGLSNLVEQLDVGRSPSYYTSPVPQQQGNSQSECELSSGTASPFPEELEQAYSPAIVRPKATAVPAIPLLDIRPPTSCLGAPRDVTHPSVRWQTSQTTAHMVYSASTLQSLVPQTAATYERLTTPAFSAVSRPSSYNLVSSLPHTITSVKLPISTTVHQTLVPPAYQLQITEHSRLQGQPMPALDPYQPSTVITDHYAPQSLMQPSVQNRYPLTVAPTMPHMAAPARPAYQLVPPAPLLQPVPVPSLPKLVNDSEREFTDLKIALDSLLNPRTDLTEQYKYRVLMEQLVLDEAKLIAQACRHHPAPYSAAMTALQRQYGQPHQLAQSEVAALMNSPDIKAGDSKAFQSFALNVDLLVGMLTSLEGPHGRELTCTGHVDRLLSKLPKHYRDGFIEHLQLRGRLSTDSLNPYNLHDLTEWLKVKAEAQRLSSKMAQRYHTEKAPAPRRERPATLKPQTRPISVYHGSNQPGKFKEVQPIQTEASTNQQTAKRTKRLCLFCHSEEHYLSQCNEIMEFPPERLIKWIRDGKRCWKCGRTSHNCNECTLRKPCGECGDVHLRVLHRIAEQGPSIMLVTTSSDRIYVTPPSPTRRVYLKVTPVLLWKGEKTIRTYAILDDGAQRSIILPAAVQQLGLQGKKEVMALRTIRHDVTQLEGQSVQFQLSSQSKPNKRYNLDGVFSAPLLTLTEQTYPIKRLQRSYCHLRGIPLPSFSKVQPLLLIGSDYPGLIAAKEPIRLGPDGGPAAVHTQLGWVMQGPDGLLPHQLSPQQCLLTSLSAVRDPILQQVERLWQLDILPYRNEKLVVRSRQDQLAMELLESRTQRVNVDGTWRYATPLLRVPNAPPLKGTRDYVLHNLRSTEKRLGKDPEKAKVYEAEIQKLLDAGYVVKVPLELLHSDKESWFIPHHLVHHNDKDRLVFNCSFAHQGLSLNQQLLPGPCLSASLLGVLIRFRQHAVAISGDIRAMFHQVRLLSEDEPLLRFIWRNMRKEDQPDVYQWQVLPFGTTCSPCCATFALQKHVRDHQPGDDEVRQSIEQCFYVDNCLQSLPTEDEARQLVNKMRSVLASGGFEIRQWASNSPSVVEHLPANAKSGSIELWLQKNHSDPQEPALGLIWHCLDDHLGYKHRPTTECLPTMRHIYKVLASQYDPLGFVTPFTTRAKVLVQRLWAKPRGWDDPNLPTNLLERWRAWEQELPNLAKVMFPRCYIPSHFSEEGSRFSLHIFCDAAEVAYGAVAYLLIEHQGEIHTSFVMARSRVAPKRQMTMPRLELCAALAGAQLAKLLVQELTISIETTTLWTDSTTVLTWIQSESCRYKVFVGTRVAEIQELTDLHSWRYVDSASNPADDITRGKTLIELASPSRWNQGPRFLRGPPDQWPITPPLENQDDSSETRKTVFCGLTIDDRNLQMPDAAQFTSWKSLVKATYQSLHGAAASDAETPSLDYRSTEALILSQSQAESFPLEFKALKAGRPVPLSSRLCTLAPEFDQALGLIRVGGRLRRLKDSSPTAIHPVVLDPHHAVTKLLIRDYDERLLHPGPDRVFAELRRYYWVLRGRQAVKKHQKGCVQCQRWRGKPTVPIMADLPLARLRLYQPPFFSTGVDCFGPFTVKVGRRSEKRWGVIFKCLTTRCIHLDLLASLDADAFLLALRRFIARRGTPSEIVSDQGTNFRGAETELKQAFKEMEPELQNQLADQQITFKMNPPAAPHFGGTWEREIKSVKSALQVVAGNQPLPEDVLHTVLVEIEGILNSKPLGYVSSDVADVDPVTPNFLLMGRRDASLPQVVYTPEPLSKRRWRHAQTVVDHFWAYFTRHYLPNLQSRLKWQRETQDLTEDAVVMVVDPQLPRAHWPIGTIESLVPSEDGHIRSAKVRIKDRLYLRPVAKLVQLPALPDSEAPDVKD
ncbi:hypothetical protein M9458_051478 [Cirrhinus mrigala]|uniref:ribonuclease H n=1 Tax=Cirrhinus mrigala TaxID=683832 RepID=A0ABD0MT59_CIRMR